MKYRLFICVLIILIVVSEKIFSKKGFSTMNFKYWITYTIIILFILFDKNVEKRWKILILSFCLQNPTLRISLTMTFLLILLIIFRSYQVYRYMGRIIFKQYFHRPPKPTIYIANYPSDFTEYLLPGIFHPNLTFVILKGATKFAEPIFGKDRILSIDLDSTNNFENTKDIIEKRIKKNYSIFSYVEKTYYSRKNIYTLTEFRSGMFRIAQQLNIPITPVICEHIEYEYGFIGKNKPKIIILEPFYVIDIEKDIFQCRNKMAKILGRTRYKF